MYDSNKLWIEGTYQETYGTYEFDLIDEERMIVSTKHKPPYMYVHYF